MVDDEIAESYKKRKQEIQNSDMGWRERTNALDQARESHGLTMLDEIQLTAADVDKEDKIIYLILLFIGVVGLSAIFYSMETSVFLALLVMGVVLLFTTETGVALLKSMGADSSQQQQGQQPTQSSSPRQICQSCGWQNPADNNYCHDCGEPLDGRT